MSRSPAPGRPRMERMAEVDQEAVLRFLAAHGGRVRHAELVEHFRGALGGEPEQRARARERFKQLVNAVATVRTDPADGAKYVHLKKKFSAGLPPAEAAPAAGPEAPPNPEAAGGSRQPQARPQRPPPPPPDAGVAVLPAPPRDLPRISVTAEPEPRDGGPGTPEDPAGPGEGDALPAAAPEPPEAPPEEDRDSGDEQARAASLGPRGSAGDSRSEPPRSGQVPPLSVGARRKSSRLNVQPLPRGPPPGPSEELLEPPLLGWEEADGGCAPGGATTPRSSRRNLRDLVMGSSPQLKRSFFPGSSSGGGRGKSGGDSDSASLASSSAEEESSSGGSVTLDPLEHAWMLSASTGKWDSLEGLLSCEPGLLAKRDFITGFTCLHWAAKHGRQELLALLVNFASKHRLPVNINARTSGGYTALHLAAMHGHVEVVKLLVGAYDADVDIRDYSGKKASQYLSQSIAEEIKNLVGALDEDEGESAAGSGGGRWRLSKVLPSHLITYKLSHVLEDGADHHHHHHQQHHSAEGWALGKARDPGRKAAGSASGRMKPRLNKIRFRTQIIHTTPSFKDREQPLEEEEEEEERVLKSHSSSSFKLRPKSNVFG
ncbi:ankyrin repeat domain-containing protein SOWAHC [Dasypus novemcinctus]|uniref:ankyrin repeat domain-containing protein SOWAHC n=1 Tax=Dasypus novemcinctus TaxID=9361 RepID=UPI00265D9A31|nr:ankyrin repeat domain-containing protein SOWAHC [Dasypus novemcinctus]